MENQIVKVSKQSLTALKWLLRGRRKSDDRPLLQCVYAEKEFLCCVDGFRAHFMPNFLGLQDGVWEVGALPALKANQEGLVEFSPYVSQTFPRMRELCPSVNGKTPAWEFSFDSKLVVDFFNGTATEIAESVKDMEFSSCYTTTIRGYSNFEPVEVFGRLQNTSVEGFPEGIMAYALIMPGHPSHDPVWTPWGMVERVKSGTVMSYKQS